MIITESGRNQHLIMHTSVQFWLCRIINKKTQVINGLPSRESGNLLTRRQPFKFRRVCDTKGKRLDTLFIYGYARHKPHFQWFQLTGTTLALNSQGKPKACNFPRWRIGESEVDTKQLKMGSLSPLWHQQQIFSFLLCNVRTLRVLSNVLSPAVSIWLEWLRGKQSRVI